MTARAIFLATLFLLPASANEPMQFAPFMRPAAAAGGGGGGTPAFVDSTTSNEVASSTTNGVSSTLTAGNAAIVLVKWEDAVASPSVTNISTGVAFVGLGQTNANGNTYSQIFYALSVTGGTIETRVNFGATVGFSKLTLIEATNITALDAFNMAANGGETTAVATGNTNTTEAVDLLVCHIARYNVGTVTPQASWTEDTDADAHHVQHVVTSSAGAYQGAGTISIAQIWAATFAAFR